MGRLGKNICTIHKRGGLGNGKRRKRQNSAHLKSVQIIFGWQVSFE